MMKIGMHNKLSGGCGEDAACNYLKKHGYKIVERNYRCKFGEIDIIARKKGVLIFAEVKTRTSDEYGTPAQAVTYYKRKNVINSAHMYVLKNPTDSDIRFDIIEVYGNFDGGVFCVDEINHIENAFWEE